MSMRFFSPTVFMVAFSVTYAAVFLTNSPLFIYYPLRGDFNWGHTVMKDVGPPMLWYGFLADSFIVASLGACVVPERLAHRALGTSAWLFPVAATGVCIYLLRRLLFRWP